MLSAGVTLFATAEAHAAHPPHTWTVQRRAQGRAVTYRVMIAPGVCADTAGTRPEAQKIIDRPDSWLRRQYDREAAAHAARQTEGVPA